jgi:hypothetical protein
MRVLWRAALILAVAIASGMYVSHAVMVHELARGSAPPAEIRLSSWMAGLFVGSVLAVLVGIALTVRRGR